MVKTTYQEEDLAGLAKKLRDASGKTQREIAEALGVARPNIAKAEDPSITSLTKLRIRIIELCSSHKVVGPRYWLD